MTIQLMRRAIRLYNSPYVSREVNKRNRLAWLSSMQMLGDNLILRGAPAKWGHKEHKAEPCPAE